MFKHPMWAKAGTHHDEPVVKVFITGRYVGYIPYEKLETFINRLIYLLEAHEGRSECSDVASSAGHHAKDHAAPNTSSHRSPSPTPLSVATAGPGSSSADEHDNSSRGVATADRPKISPAIISTGRPEPSPTSTCSAAAAMPRKARPQDATSGSSDAQPKRNLNEPWGDNPRPDAACPPGQGKETVPDDRGGV
jgi:hypothetical protein